MYNQLPKDFQACIVWEVKLFFLIQEEENMFLEKLFHNNIKKKGTMIKVSVEVSRYQTPTLYKIIAHWLM